MRHDFRWWRYELQAKEYLTGRGHEAIHWPKVTVEVARKVGLEWNEEKLNWRYHSNGTCVDVGCDVLQIHKDGSLQSNQPKLFLKTKLTLRRLGTAWQSVPRSTPSTECEACQITLLGCLFHQAPDTVKT